MAADTSVVADVILTPEAERQLERLPAVILARVRRLLVRLESWPNTSGAKPLSGKLAGRFRLRTGDYRLRFFPKDRGKMVVVDRIGHRSKFYDD